MKEQQTTIINIKPLKQLEAIRDEIGKLKRKESEIVKPITKDVRLIKDAYSLFREFIQKKRICGWDKTKFIFVIVYLYAPSVITGDRLPHKLRSEIASVTGMNPSAVSQNCKRLLFFFEKYNEFKSTCNSFMKFIVDGLHAT